MPAQEPIHDARLRLTFPLVLLLLAIGPATARGAAVLEETVSQLEAALPKRASDFAQANPAGIAELAGAVEAAAFDATRVGPTPAPGVLLQLAERIIAVKARIDRAVDATLALGPEFPPALAGGMDREAVRNYLKASSKLIDLSGRLRYLSRDAFGVIASELATRPAERERFIDLLTKAKSSIGAVVMADLLADPPEDTETGAAPPSPALRAKVLALIAATRQSELLQNLAEYVQTRGLPPALVIQAAETIREVGLPQDPGPGQDPTLPKPEITAAQLRAVVASIRERRLPTDLVRRRDALLTWLQERATRGLTERVYRCGAFEARPGDWLLMRNPSPYNLFTDLSPGLFTHVGIVTMRKDADGRERMVVVDLPERGAQMPATNVDTFVKRTRHYVFVRHRDSKVAEQMATAALQTIGDEVQFDLNFRADRVLPLKGQNLAGKKIHTYCAGLLLLCALQTSEPKEAFFPVTEFPASGETSKNLAILGLEIGKNFISPTGALFSKDLSIAARREPMYDPRREVEEAIYDHFASAMSGKDLTVSPDVFQSLRLKVAEQSQSNPLLAQALSAAAGVSPETDLVSAAKAAAVVETLDEIATSSSREFLRGLEALKLPSLDELAEEGATPDQLDEVRKFRERHAKQFEAWIAGRLSPRQLRMELVKFYVDEGNRRLDARFFAAPTK